MCDHNNMQNYNESKSPFCTHFPPSDCDKRKAKHVYGVAIAFVSPIYHPQTIANYCYHSKIHCVAFLIRLQNVSISLKKRLMGFG